MPPNRCIYISVAAKLQNWLMLRSAGLVSKQVGKNA